MFQGAKANGGKMWREDRKQDCKIDCGTNFTIPSYWEVFIVRAVFVGYVWNASVNNQEDNSSVQKLDHEHLDGNLYELNGFVSPLLPRREFSDDSFEEKVEQNDQKRGAVDKEEHPKEVFEPGHTVLFAVLEGKMVDVNEVLEAVAAHETLLVSKFVVGQGQVLAYFPVWALLQLHLFFLLGSFVL